MAASIDTFDSLDDALNHRFRGHAERDWDVWAQRHHFEGASDIPDAADRAWLSRRQLNYCGLGTKRALRHVVASNVDQSYLEEIAELEDLQRLELEWPVVATDLTPLRRLRSLNHLSIDTPRQIADFMLLAELTSLRSLFITNATKMTDLEWVRGAKHLEVLGIEGAIDKTFPIPSLGPLAELTALQAFFGVSTRLVDKSLAPLTHCTALRYLKVARWAPQPAFDELKRCCPDLFCSWFDPAVWGKLQLRRAEIQQ